MKASRKLSISNVLASLKLQRSGQFSINYQFFNFQTDSFDNWIIENSLIIEN